MKQEKYHDPNPVVAFALRRFFERIGGLPAKLEPQSLLDAGSTAVRTPPAKSLAT